MIYIKAFENYSEFKNIFGIVEHGNGVKTRRNAILMAYYKCTALRRKLIADGDLGALSLRNMADLKCEVYGWLESHEAEHDLHLNGNTFHSDVYSTDHRQGLCEDGDTTRVRYIKHEDGREKEYKMKPGKLMGYLLAECERTSLLPEQAANWIRETFTTDWNAHAETLGPQYELHVDKDFEAIYDSYRCLGDFHSCMTDEDRHGFYLNSVKAHAAYLTNVDGKIVARCVIFDEVFDDDGNKYRYAERQYSTGCDDKLKQTLINKLIAGGYIDCYKQVGVDCHNSRAIVNINGESMEDIDLNIDCDLDEDEVLSYQDTFKWYDISKREAFNHQSNGYDYELKTTDRTLVVGEYDDYHERYCREVTTVYFNGIRYTCDSDDLDDFVYIDSELEYHHIDDCFECDRCGQWELRDNCCHSEITGYAYCCEDCMEVDEREYKESNWSYSDYDDDWYEEVEFWKYWDGSDFIEESISRESLDKKKQAEEVYEYDGEYYDIDGCSPVEAIDRILTVA